MATATAPKKTTKKRTAKKASRPKAAKPPTTKAKAAKPPAEKTEPGKPTEDPRARSEKVNVGVKFGGISLGDMTATLGVVVDRERLKLAQADRLLCQKLVDVKIQIGGSDDGSEQKEFIERPAIEASCETKKLSTSAKAVGTGLIFSTNEVDLDDLIDFRKQTGRLVVYESKPMQKEPKKKAK